MHHHRALVVVFLLLAVSGLAPAALAGERAVLVAAGHRHTCAVTASGKVLCWGSNDYGQLGDGTNAWRLTPTAVAGLGANVQGIAAGGGGFSGDNFSHTCALTAAGGVVCWGSNSHGQLGDNSTTDSSTPVQVSGLTSGVSAIAAGGAHTCALTDAGAVLCWGLNENGQLGNGSLTNSRTPVQVNGITSGATRITAGHSHTCAVVSGAARCWGYGLEGQLGTGTQDDSSVPIQVTGLTNGVASITAGHYFTCAVTAAGAAKCWGTNQYGELGIGTQTPVELSPVQVSGLTNGVVGVAAGWYHGCAFTNAGAVLCWGNNSSGELGDGTNNLHLTPEPSCLTAGARGLDLGSHHSCAVTAGGAVRCWGRNLQGQLGNNSTLGESEPVAAWTLGGWPPMDITGDAKSDVLWRHATLGDVWLWPMNGASKTAESYVKTVTEPGWQIRGLADFDGDGKTDILWRHAPTGMIYLWRMDDSTVLSETYVSTVETVYDIAGTADYSGDGKADIGWRHVSNGELWVWTMDGATPLETIYVATVEPAYVVVGSGDLDGNGNADIVWRHAANGQVWVWLIGEIISEAWVGTVEDPGYEIVGVTDHTGDGKADILWHHALRGEVWMWPMDGAAKVSEAYIETVPDIEYRIAGNGDYDFDGKADILWHHATRGEVWVWLMDGTTKFSETWVATVPDTGYRIIK